MNDPVTPWELWRQDDNGKRYLVAAYSVQTAAKEQLRRLSSGGHKQIYWIVYNPAVGPGTPDGRMP